MNMSTALLLKGMICVSGSGEFWNHMDVIWDECSDPNSPLLWHWDNWGRSQECGNAIRPTCWHLMSI